MSRLVPICSSECRWLPPRAHAERGEKVVAGSKASGPMLESQKADVEQALKQPTTTTSRSMSQT